MPNNYDYIIVGSGAAGLSLAYRILESEKLSNKSVLLLDRQSKDANDRTWCFWNHEPLSYKASQSTYWSELEFKSDDKRFPSKLKRLKYYHVNSLEFYEEIYEKINQASRFIVKQEAVTNIVDREGEVEVYTNTGKYFGKYVFNSVIDLLPSSGMLEKPELWQHFFGKTITAQKPIFQDFKVRLMDFSFPNKDTVQFGYILPFTQHKALIEYTEFSKESRPHEEYEALLQEYISKLGIEDFEVGYIEKGKIPMSLHEFPRFSSDKILNIGTAGGFTKPTTGYTFMNIQKDVASIVNSLESGKPFIRKKQKPRFRFYDSLLLGIIMREPSKTKGIMTKLFKNNPMERILKFLDEESTLIDEAKIFMQLPWKPFLKQLFLR